MRHLDLFAGIGGFSLAAQWMGWTTVAQVEWDEWCQKVLAKNFPDALRFGDIVEFNKMLKNGEIIKNSEQLRCNGGKREEKSDMGGFGQSCTRDNDRLHIRERIGHIDIITGGFPCQPFSHAGKRKGTDDSRYLWPAMLETIRRVKPTYVVGENVAGLVSMENGKTLDRILSDLEDEGYTTEQVIIPACAVGAWHRRDRIWIIAKNTGCDGCRNGEHDKQGRIGDIGQFMPGSKEWNIRKKTERADASDSRLLRPEINEEQAAGVVECSENSSDPNSQGSQGGAGQRIQANEGREDHCGIGQPSGYNNSRLRESEDNRKFKSRICGMADDVSGELDKNRLNDGKTEERRPDNYMQELRKAACEKNNKRENGRSGSDAEKEILRQDVYGEISDKRKSRLSYDAKKAARSEGAILRTLWNGSSLANTSYRRGLDEQFDRQLDDTLRQLSCEMALAEWEEHAEETIGMQSLWEGVKRIGFMPKTLSEVQEIWQSLTYQTMEWIIIYTCSGDSCWAEIPCVPRVATGVKDRVNRLKGLGNAIVPQVAYEVFKAIEQLNLKHHENC